MNSRKCPVCNAEINDDTLNVCPVCNAELNQVCNTEPDPVCSTESDPVCSTESDPVCSTELNQEEENIICETCDELDVQSFEDTEIPQEDEKPSKKVKIITAVVAAIMVLAVGVFGWYLYSGSKPTYAEDLVKKDIRGVFADFHSGMYFDFTAKKAELEVPDYSDDDSADSAALSDGEASSDGDQVSSKTKTVTYDGTYESGFTKEYVQKVLVDIYISENDLTEDYEDYLKEKNIASDDYLGFAKEKGISKKDLDEIDEAQGISVQGESYKESGYWNFDSKNKEIDIYSIYGDEVVSLKIVGDAIVDPTGYLKETADKIKFSSVFAYSEDEYKETITIYDDGNYIAKGEQKDSEPQYYAGEYKEDATTIVLDINGRKMPYTKVNGGISYITYKKQ